MRCYRWLLSGANDLVVKLWDVDSGALVRNFRRHTEPVTAIAWLPACQGQFVTGSYDKQLIIWHVDSPQPQVCRSLPRPHGHV